MLAGTVSPRQRRPTSHLCDISSSLARYNRRSELTSSLFLVILITRSSNQEGEIDVSSENLPHRSGSDGDGDELTAIVADPRMRWWARRLAGDLAEDLLQETWYAVTRASARRTIDNPRAYFSRVMVNGAKRMREDIARQGVPVDDPVAAAGPRRGRELAAVSAEDDALLRLVNAARRELLRRRQAELRRGIPACSQDPNRYRDVILDLVGQMLADDGPVSRAEVNAALIAAYPEWFDPPDVAVATKYQRRCRGRDDIRRMLAAVTGLLHGLEKTAHRARSSAA
jgi:DNA-directed RNA polymerase specialized sigma24 family protein